MNKFNSFKAAAIIAAASVSTLAHAEIFSYNTSLAGNPVVLSVDTDRGTATYVGSGTNVTYSGADFSSFNPDRPRGAYRFTGARGTINNGGTDFRPVVRSKEPVIRFRGNGTVSLWTRAVDPSGKGAPFDLPGPFSPVPPSSTSTGGLSSTGGVGSSGGPSGPSGSSGGGTSVPAPGILGLLGLGIAGLAFGRRKKSK